MTADGTALLRRARYVRTHPRLWCRDCQGYRVVYLDDREHLVCTACAHVRILDPIIGLEPFRDDA